MTEEERYFEQFIGDAPEPYVYIESWQPSRVVVTTASLNEPFEAVIDRHYKAVNRP